ncbi:MAG TPA: hypothetical protein VIM41_17395 [Gammaproteobacteria bacterium]
MIDLALNEHFGQPFKIKASHAEQIYRAYEVDSAVFGDYYPALAIQLMDGTPKIDGLRAK